MSKVSRAIIALAVLVVLVIIGCSIYNRVKDDHVFRVVLDAGHGGHDPGAVSGEIYEKDINLAILLLVQEKLNEKIEAEGYKKEIVVYVTRDEDVFLSLSERAKFANKHNADFFISIHANSLGDNTEYEGIFTFYHPNKMLDKAHAEIIQKHVSKSGGGIDRGVNSADYAVLRETNMSAVLLETGFMSCPRELKNLIDPQYQDLIAQGIVDGIFDIYENSKEGS